MRGRLDEGGASLVGTLVVLVILGGLAGLAVAALPDDPVGTSGRLEGLTPEAGPAGGGAGSGGVQGRPRSAADGATTGTCTANVRALEAAAATKQARDGTFPATVAEAVAAGGLSEAPALRGYDLTMQAVGGRPTGKVLVNGLPAEQGCAGPPRFVP